MKKRCIYCLKYFDSITMDHVFPKSWYLKSVPKNIEKWKVPSCARCNNIYSKLEEKLLTDISFFKEIPPYGILPNFGPTTRIVLPGYTTIRISPIDLEKFGGKLTKGFTYIFYNLLVRK